MKTDEEFDRLIIHKDGTVEVELRTITDTKLQYNDLVIEYDSKENTVNISFDCFTAALEPTRVRQYTIPVKEKEKIVCFKMKWEFGIPFQRRIFDTENLCFDERIPDSYKNLGAVNETGN